jgi:ADP-ribose pyrophosphatase
MSMINDSPDLKEIIISSQPIYDGKILKLRKDIVYTSQGVESYREIIEHRPAVVIVPFLTPDRLILVQQHRVAVNQILTEFPAGLINLGEKPLDAAKRELREETGYIAHQWIKLGNMYSSPGFCDEFLHFFVATQLEKDTIDPDEDEIVAVIEMATYELEQQIKNFIMIDAKTITGYLLTSILDQHPNFVLNSAIT